MTDGGRPGDRENPDRDAGDSPGSDEPEPPEGSAREPPEGGPSHSRDAAAHAAAVADALAGYDRVLEVGIGDRTAVAARLAGRGVDVLAVDVRAVETPDGVAFERADVTGIDPARYRGVGAVYALRLPPELQRAVADLARAVGADLAFTTLGGDPVTVPTRPETVPGGTLHWLVDRDAGGGE